MVGVDTSHIQLHFQLVRLVGCASTAYRDKAVLNCQATRDFKTSAILESSNGDICGTGDPIDFVFDSRVAYGFQGRRIKTCRMRDDDDDDVYKSDTVCDKQSVTIRSAVLTLID